MDSSSRKKSTNAFKIAHLITIKLFNVHSKFAEHFFQIL